MEILGFCDIGRGEAFARGKMERHGRIVNTGGGLVGFGHPVGATE